LRIDRDFGLDPVSPEYRQQKAAVDAAGQAAAIEHDRLVDQFGDGDLAPAGPAMVRRQGDGHRLFIERFPDQIGMVETRPDEADMDAPVQQRRLLLERQHFVQQHLHARMLGMKPAQGRRQQQVHGRADIADADPADLAAPDPTRPGDGLLQLGDQGRRLGLEKLAGLGQAQRPAAAFQQLQAQLVLQLADLLAQRRLGDMQAQGGAAEIQLLGHRQEVAEMTQLHQTFRL
jgi:hypothetical protein